MTRNSKFRQLVFERDGKCQDCGAIEDLIAHHIVPLSLGGEDTPDNGVTLCSECHNNRHSGDLTSFALSRPAREEHRRQWAHKREVLAPASVMLYTEQVLYFRSVCGGVSAGIRAATDAYLEKHPQGGTITIDRSLTDSLTAVKVTLRPEQINFLKELGKGKVSRGIRIVTDAHMQAREQAGEGGHNDNGL